MGCDSCIPYAYGIAPATLGVLSESIRHLSTADTAHCSLPPICLFDSAPIYPRVSIDFHVEVRGVVSEKFLSCGVLPFVCFSRLLFFSSPVYPMNSMATLIGLCVRVKLLRSLPSRFKVTVEIAPGTHSSEEAGKALRTFMMLRSCWPANSVCSWVLPCLTSYVFTHVHVMDLPTQS